MTAIYDDLTFILLCITGVLFFVQIIYLFCVYNIPHINGRNKKEETLTPPLSVIIVTKGSVEQIKNNLHKILEQDYPDYEVIVVYEQGEKLFEEELKHLQEKYKNLYHTFIPETAKYISHKKLGVTIGIKAAKNDILVFTEPDAYPTSDKWLRKLASNFTKETDIVLGYSNYEKKKGWFNRKIIFDRLLQSMRYLGLAIQNLPFSASGYNLAYRKSLFYDNNGFNKHLNLQRGEDDLFVNEYASTDNTKVETSPESVVRINAPQYKYEWVEDKLSKLITRKYYKGAGKYLAGFETTSRLFFIFVMWATIALSALSFNWLFIGIAIAFAIIRFIIQICVFKNTCKNFGERRYYSLLPIFDIYQPLIEFHFLIKKKLANKKDFLRK